MNAEKKSYTRSYKRYPRKKGFFLEQTFCKVVIKLITLEKYYGILLTFMKLKYWHFMCELSDNFIVGGVTC